MAIQESGEMYLETILVLSQKKKLVRSIDVAERMNFSKPAISRAIAKLKEDKYVLVDHDGYIALTEKGRDIAERIYERHTTLTSLLVRLGVDEKIAAEDACRMEHDMSEETFEAIKRHVNKYSNADRT